MKPYLWALLTAVVWGCVPVIEKTGLLKVPVWTGLFYRCIGVVVGIFVIAIFKWGEIKPLLWDKPQGWYFLLIGGLLASVIGQLFFYHSLKTGEASQVVPIAAAYPLISFILGVLFFKEGVTLVKLGGMFFILLGIFLIK